MDGLVLIDKPKSWTSFDVVAKVRNVLKKHTGQKIKVGHTGTLDPLATGLLVLTIGNYCKRAQEYTKLDKTYEVTMKLGEMSTTGDDEGEKSTISTHQPSEQNVRHTIEQFIGDIEQIPPAFSAIKVNGKRAYELARQGKPVELESRWIKIHSITDVSYEYPFVRYTTNVSSGTYIRTLVEDIGHVLRTGAYMTNLRRTTVGDFRIEDAATIETIIQTDSIESYVTQA